MIDEGTYGRYQLIRRLAAGGMAELFLARSSAIAGFEKLVVIKRILPKLAAEPEFVEMFLDEARLAAAMSHPNIVQIFDLGQANGTYYLAMEYVAGLDLHAVLREHRKRGVRMPAELAARVISNVADGLGYAHALKDRAGQPLHLVHRDVTPSNVLLAYGGAVKLVDFGIAKAQTQSSQSAAGRTLGNARYLSPEQVSLEPLEGRSDIWSAGLCLYELVTGTRAFNGENELQVMKAVLDKPIVPPREVVGDVPEALEGIVMKCLRRPRAERYATALELHRDLEAYLKRAPGPSTVGDLGSYLRGFFAKEFEASEQLALELATVPSPHPTSTAPGAEAFQPPKPSEPDYTPARGALLPGAEPSGTKRVPPSSRTPAGVAASNSAALEALRKVAAELGKASLGRGATPAVVPEKGAPSGGSSVAAQGPTKVK